MAVDLRGIFAYWESIGVFDIVLPFFLIFAVAYSIFSSTKVLKDNKITIDLKGIHSMETADYGKKTS